MKKNVLFFLFITICRCSTFAQINLVLNPSFENYTNCPNRYDQISYAKYWSSIDTSWAAGDTAPPPPCNPDLCHTCATLYPYMVPNNARFYQYPHTGNAVAQVQTYYINDAIPSPVKRDYLQGRLKNTLVAGKQYCVSFFTNFEEFSAYATNKIGAYFDNGTIDTTTNCTYPQTTHTPQVYTTSIITDTANWTKIEGTFTAIGSEKFITLGNFFDAANTDTIRVYFPRAISAGNNAITWYLIDDVSVIATDAVAYAGRDTAISSRLTDSAWVGNHDGYLPTKWYVNGVLADSNTSGFMVHPATTTQYVMELTVCGNVTRDTMVVTVWPLGLGNVQMRQLGNVQMAPNPVVNEMMIDGAGGTDVSVMDLAGRVIMGFHVATDKETVDVSGLLPGVYVVAVVDRVSGERVCRRVVKE